MLLLLLLDGTCHLMVHVLAVVLHGRRRRRCRLILQPMVPMVYVVMRRVNDWVRRMLTGRRLMIRPQTATLHPERAASD